VKRVAVIGLIGFLGAAAHAQTSSVQGPASPSPAAPAAACQIVSKLGEQYVEAPLAGFDPSLASQPLPSVQASSGAQMVLCNRPTIVPQVSDYRVLTEMHLPLAIRSGAKTLFVGVKDGRVQLALPEGDATAEEMTALRARQDEMQTAMTAKTAKK
jgi:hypothetical protein